MECQAACQHAADARDFTYSTKYSIIRYSTYIVVNVHSTMVLLCMSVWGRGSRGARGGRQG